MVEKYAIKLKFKIFLALNLFEKPCNVTFCGSQNNLDYFNTFKSLFDNLPNHIQKTYIQELPHEQIKSLFLETDVMVLPSLGENFGHAIFESLAFSTPVIVGNNTIWNHLEEQKIGFEIEPLSHLQLLEKLNLISDFTQSQYEDYQNNAFQKALNFYHSNNLQKNPISEVFEFIQNQISIKLKNRFSQND